jgi:hypothetical protein
MSNSIPVLVSIEGLYQQLCVALGNDQWIFLAAKIRNAGPNNSDKITTLFLHQAQKLANEPTSLPLDQEVTVHDVSPGMTASASNTARSPVFQGNSHSTPYMAR